MNFIYKQLPVSLTEKMLFTKNLAVMIQGGISLPRSLKILASQARHPYFKNSILETSQSIQKGMSLTEALQKHKRAFKQFYVSMIKIGEKSGNLEQSLNILAKQLKKEHELISKIRGAMAYPALILLTLVGIGIAMFVFVVPQVSKIFTEMQAELPLSTRFFLSTSSNIRAYGIYLILGIIIIIFGFYFCLRQKFCKKIFDKLLLYLPFIGKMSQKTNITRFVGNLSSLLESDVPLIDALETLQGVLKNNIYCSSLKDISNKVQKGEALSQALNCYPRLYSSLVVQMTEVGEQTGTMSDSLMRLAEFYQAEIDETMQNISSIIEPVLMIIIGSVVGFFTLSIISPIYSMMQNI